MDAYNEHKDWFEDCSCDVKKNLLHFRTANEKNKNQLREYLKRKAEEQHDDIWAADFIEIFELLDHSLEDRLKELG